MKYTMAAALVAALAAIPSVIAAPSAAVSTSLPGKFTLEVTTPTSGTALQNFLGQVTVDFYASQLLNIGDGSNQNQVPVTLFKDGDSGFHVENIDGLGNWGFRVTADGMGIFSAGPNKPWVGFGQLNGALVLDTGDGKGPLALWSACPDRTFRELWEVYWNPSTSIKNCIPIGLTVIPI